MDIKVDGWIIGERERERERCMAGKEERREEGCKGGERWI